MIDRMVADDIDDRGLRLMGVVQIGEAVREARTEMQKRCGRLIHHASIAIGGPRYHAFEQAEDAAHPVDPVERCDEMHLRGSGIAETNLDAAGYQRPHKTFGSIHDCTSLFVEIAVPATGQDDEHPTAGARACRDAARVRKNVAEADPRA